MKIASGPGFAAFVVLNLALALTGRAALAADADALLGAWALNAAKSTLPQGTPQVAVTVTVSDAGTGKLKSVTETSVAGQSFRVEITFAMDGKDYTPTITPAPPGMPATSQSYERVSAKSYKSSVKANGEVAATSLTEVSADGKTMTVTTTGVGPAAGVSTKLVFDKK